MKQLVLQNLTLRVQQRQILHPLNYTVETGDFVILLGRNGSGKSSLLKLLYRDYVPSSGEIILANQGLKNYSRHAFAQAVAVLTQDARESLFPTLTIYENYVLVQKNK